MRYAIRTVEILVYHDENKPFTENQVADVGHLEFVGLAILSGDEKYIRIEVDMDTLYDMYSILETDVAIHYAYEEIVKVIYAKKDNLA